MKQTEGSKRGEVLFEDIKELSFSTRREALKNREVLPEYLILGAQESIDLAEYCVTEKLLNIFDAPGTGRLFGLTFISDEKKILKLGGTAEPQPQPTQ